MRAILLILCIFSICSIISAIDVSVTSQRQLLEDGVKPPPSYNGTGNSGDEALFRVKDLEKVVEAAKKQNIRAQDPLIRRIEALEKQNKDLVNKLKVVEARVKDMRESSFSFGKVIKYILGLGVVGGVAFAGLQFWKKRSRGAYNTNRSGFGLHVA